MKKSELRNIIREELQNEVELYSYYELDKKYAYDIKRALHNLDAAYKEIKAGYDYPKELMDNVISILKDVDSKAKKIR